MDRVEARSSVFTDSRRVIAATRLLWIAVAATVLLLLVASIPAFLEYLNEHAQDAQFVRSLEQLGLSRNFYYVWGLLVGFVPCASFYLVGSIIYWRKPHDAMVYFVSLTLVALVASFPTIQIMASANPNLWFWPTELIVIPSYVMITLLFYLFPSGRFVPAWTRRLMVIWAAMIPGLFLLVTYVFDQEKPVWFSLTLTVLGLFWLGSMTYAQIYRYRRVATPRERQQTKWAVFGLVTAMATTVLYVVSSDLLYRAGVPDTLGLPYGIILGTITVSTVSFVPLAIGLSILRYHLWDIDFIISRALVYAAITGGLTLAYFASVLVIQQIALIVTGGQQSSVAIAASTLVIAALFQPVRRRIQLFVDRRFDRPEPDSAPVSASAAEPQPLDEPLSQRELEVLRLIADGLSNQAIAARLVITEGTVKRHTTNIYGKLDVRSRTQAIARARGLGLIT